ncbi:type IV pilin protein [Sulfuriroseicoccus oceanibius]|uniref:Type II secretion system protein n=1 Tax=Sulfuriroseicoccus oceanibius TaxID=2707525 RepID=A0A6B3LBW1_9BACT|nr:type II secretion system protein [Sulfuriroseicoccus oceanibius]QQL45261.1 type II secretion system protein [Sulfuriroseicoccus oceanibius]
MKKRINNQGFTLIELLVVITIIGVLATISFSGYTQFIEKSRVTKAISAAKNVHSVMSNYASENNGRFPQKGKKAKRIDATYTDAETVFRDLIAGGYSSDEGDFTVDNSPSQPDGYVGEGPEYRDAFSSADGGVHWALLGDGTDTMKGSCPLAWENSVSGGWNPTWDPELAGTSDPGRTWTSGKVIMVTVSGKSEALDLENPEAESKLKNLGDGSKNPFTAAYSKPREVLDPNFK